MEAFMRKCHRDEGQAAIVDAIMFMTIMLVASAVILGASGGWYNRDSNDGILQYTTEYASTVLRMELPGASYTDPCGQFVDLNGSMRSVGFLLCDEAMILEFGPGSSNFSEYNDAMLTACKNIIRPGLGFAISCNEGSVFISGSISGIRELPDTRSASHILISPYPEMQSSVSITFYVWVV